MMLTGDVAMLALEPDDGTPETVSRSSEESPVNVKATAGSGLRATRDRSSGWIRAGVGRVHVLAVQHLGLVHHEHTAAHVVSRAARAGQRKAAVADDDDRVAYA
jgi:hypothetical protein